MKTLKMIPERERPIEKILFGDMNKVSDTELLCAIIGSGSREEDALCVSGRIRASGRTFRGLLEGLSTGSLGPIKGLGKVKKARLLAAFEMAKRFAEERKDLPGFKVSSPEDAAEAFMLSMRDLGYESFRCLFLDAKNRILVDKEISRGSPVSVNPSVRTIFSEAMKRNTVSLICMHNHPSGDPTPSVDDISFTKEISLVAAALDIRVLDHIVFGANAFYSMRQKGVIS
jgi:DNA repair protein RadC